MRLQLIQHHLVNRLGHSYNEALAWKRVLAEQGHELRLFINRAAQPEMIADTGGIALFPFRSGDVVSQDPVIGRLQSFSALGPLFAKTLLEAMPDIAAADVVVVPYSTDVEVHGAALWLAQLPAERRPRMVFIFHNPDYAWRVNLETSKVAGNISFHRFAAHRIKQLLPAERRHFYATEEKLAGLLSNVMELPFSQCPVPVEQIDARADAPVGGEPFHVGVIGHLRPETGSNILADVLDRFCRARPGKRIFVQGADQQIDGIAARLDAIEGADCTYWRGAMPQPDYVDHLRSLEILLLPYMGERYIFRTSGRFTEAVGQGIVCVVPAQGWMARQLRAGWGAGVQFDDLNAESVAAALIEASDRLAELQVTADARKDEWRKRQNVVAMIELVLDGLHAA